MNDDALFVLIFGAAAVAYYYYAQQGATATADASFLNSVAQNNANEIASSAVPAATLGAGLSAIGNIDALLGQLAAPFLGTSDPSTATAGNNTTGNTLTPFDGTGDPATITTDTTLTSTMTIPLTPSPLLGGTGTVDIAAVTAYATQLTQQAEGLKLTVYADSLGKPTVGYGHLVTAADSLKLGQTITQSRANSLFATDLQTSLNAAISQGQELGHVDTQFVGTLASVNFQLGTGWPQTFYGTWNALVSGDGQSAITHIEGTTWYQQTPTRAEDFIAAIVSSYGVEYS